MMTKNIQGENELGVTGTLIATSFAPSRAEHVRWRKVFGYLLIMLSVVPTEWVGVWIGKHGRVKEINAA